MEETIEVPQSTIETVLDPYAKECRYLKEAELQRYPDSETNIPYSRIRGQFNLEETYKNTLLTSNYFLCYNQLGYSLFAEIVCRGMVEEKEEMSIGEFRDKGTENYFIIGEEELNYLEPPESSFKGEIIIKGHEPRVRGAVHIFDTHFNFEDQNAFGEVKLGLDFREQD